MNKPRPMPTAAGAATAMASTGSAAHSADFGVEDLVLLSPLSESEIERNLRVRFARDLIYTNIGPVLLAVNPFREIPGLYSEEMVDFYRAGGAGGGGGVADVTGLAPGGGGGGASHIFALAEDTYRTMVAEEEDQCVIISGESGAGKTEASKQIMRYISSVSGDTPAMTHVKRIMLESNPLMEAFGNAKTLRNDNSSRFGKFLQIHFDRRGGPVGGRMTIFLLEKARVVYHQRGERNFHIFYQLCAGLGRGADGIVRRRAAAPQPTTARLPSDTNKDGDDGEEDAELIDHGALREKLRIGPASGFQYLCMGENLTRAGVDDAAEWQQTLQAMHVVGMPESVVEQVITTLALVLHLGEIRFSAPGDATTPSSPSDEKKTGVPTTTNAACQIVNEAGLAYCASLLGVAPEKLARALTWRRLEVGQSEVVHVPLDLQQCHQARDAVAKALYDSIFNIIVYCVNAALSRVAADVEAEKKRNKTHKSGDGEDDGAGDEAPVDRPGEAAAPPLMLGVLDIYGFEIFDSNGFEQFCINYVNEKLQQIFIELTLCAEQEEYVREGIAWEPVQYFDNRVVVDLIESTTPPVGLFAVMDDVCAAMAKEDESVVDVKMLDKLQSAAAGHVRRVKTLYDAQHPEEAARRAEQWERQERARQTTGTAGAREGDEADAIQADFGAAHFSRTDRGFVIKHYAGDVRYDAHGFTARNKDRLSKDVVAMLAGSDKAFLLELLTEHGDVLTADDIDDARIEGTSGKRAPAPTAAAAAAASRKRSTTAGTKIRAQAAELVETLKRCNPHYVRTIKSNDKKQGRLFDDARVRHQVKYLGLLENVRVRRAGYSYRQYFDKFLKRFRYVCPQTYPRPYKGTDVQACQVLLEYVSRHHSQGPKAFPLDAWQAGVHKLFVRQPAHLAALEQARTEAFDAIAVKVQRAWRRYVNRRLYVQLKCRMATLYAAHGKARRADSVFRAYQGSYDCRWWPSSSADLVEEVASDASGAKSAAAAAMRARQAHLERLLRPLIQYDPIGSAWREVRAPLTATAAGRRGKVFYANDLTGQVQWEPPRGWRQGLQTIIFMSPVRRVLDHDTAETREELLVLTDTALYMCRERLPVAGDVADQVTTASPVLPPRALPPPSTYELRTRVDLRLLAGVSLSACADELLLLHVFPLPAPYRPLLFHRTDTAGSSASSTPAESSAAHTKTTTTTIPADSSAATDTPTGAPAHAAAHRLRGPVMRYPACDGCGGRLSPSLFTIIDPPAHTDGVQFALSAEARRRHVCPCCGRWCCTTRCLVHRRPLPTMTGTLRPVKVCPSCRTGEPLEPLQDLVLLTPLKTELVSLLCRTYQQVMANPLPLRMGGHASWPSSLSSSSSPSMALPSSASMLLYQLAEDKGGPRGVLVMPRDEAGSAAWMARTAPSRPAGAETTLDTISPTTGERGEVRLALKDACYWASPLASTLLAPAVPYRDALHAQMREATAKAATASSSAVPPDHRSRTGQAAESPPTESQTQRVPGPVSFLTVLAAPGIAPAVVQKVEAAREVRRQAAAALRREEEAAQRQREAARDVERAAVHRRLVQERKQARAAAELREEEQRLQHEAEAREREAKKERLLREKQKLL